LGLRKVKKEGVAVIKFGVNKRGLTLTLTFVPYKYNEMAKTKMRHDNEMRWIRITV